MRARCTDDTGHGIDSARRPGFSVEPSYELVSRPRPAQLHRVRSAAEARGLAGRQHSCPWGSARKIIHQRALLARRESIDFQAVTLREMSCPSSMTSRRRRLWCSFGRVRGPGLDSARAAGRAGPGGWACMRRSARRRAGAARRAVPCPGVAAPPPGRCRAAPPVTNAPMQRCRQAVPPAVGVISRSCSSGSPGVYVACPVRAQPE
jgi:hypothetical protein